MQLGDNIFGSSSPDAAESLFRAFGPAMESGLPWAAVLGNHDQESTMSREELMSLISLMDYSVSQINPLDDDLTNSSKGGMMTKIDGFGNYNLRVYGAPGSMVANSTVLNLFFLDSGDRAVYQGIRTYGWIRESQLNWLRRVSQKFQVTTKSEYCNQLLVVLTYHTFANNQTTVFDDIIKYKETKCYLLIFIYFNFDMLLTRDCVH